MPQILDREKFWRDAGAPPRFVTRLSCACADRAAGAAAPLAHALFRRVEARGQSPEDAARALGIGPLDGAYLLAGLRRDAAVKLVELLGAVPGPGSDDRPKGSDT